MYMLQTKCEWPTEYKSKLLVYVTVLYYITPYAPITHPSYVVYILLYSRSEVIALNTCLTYYGKRSL